MVIRETVFANYRFRGGGSDSPMGRLIMWQFARGNCDSGGVTGTVDVYIDVDVATA